MDHQHDWVAMGRWRKHDRVLFDRCRSCGARRYGDEIRLKKARKTKGTTR